MYTTLIIGSDQIQIEIAWVWELGFAQQERKRRGGKRRDGKRRGGRTWWVLVAGEGPEDRAGHGGGGDRQVVATRNR